MRQSVTAGISDLKQINYSALTEVNVKWYLQKSKRTCLGVGGGAGV